MADQAGLSLVDRAQMKMLVRASSKSPRLRAHLLLHSGAEDPVQRLLIAAQPGTYVRPHRHSEQWEMLALQSGSADVFCFDEQGRLLERKSIGPASPVIHIAPGVIHGCIVGAPDTVLLEVKPGPYRPNEFVAWAPEEGQRNAERFLIWASTATAGRAWIPQ